ncbi:metal ABC transporter permease [Bacteroidota bacterium]
MLSTFQFILTPLLASFLLLGLTSYFGIHVIKREIIFIDIALAQIAVLGGVIVMFLDHHLPEQGIMVGNGNLSHIVSYVFSLLFCLLAAIIFTLLKNSRIKVPIEAFIGIAYAFATTAAVIILDKGTGGEVHLHEMMAGALLWTTWPQVIRLTIVLIIIGGFHAAFHTKFIQLSEYYLGRSNPLKGHIWWDFLFYFTFGIVIIEAVRIAGILTVFAFLILPASISALFSTHWDKRILIGLAAGIIATISGLYLSVMLDLTASPLIILFLGIILLAGIIGRKLLLGQVQK